MWAEKLCLSEADDHNLLLIKLDWHGVLVDGIHGLAHQEADAEMFPDTTTAADTLCAWAADCICLMSLIAISCLSSVTGMGCWQMGCMGRKACTARS